MQLTEIARTSDEYVVYALAGVSQTVQCLFAGKVEIFRPAYASIAKAEDGTLQFVGLVGPRAHFDGVSINYSGAASRTFSRAEIMSETNDPQLELDLALVAEILMAEVRLFCEVVETIPQP